MAIEEIQILSWQAEWMNEDADIVFLVGGFASGKTFIASNWFVDRCMQFPDANHCLVGKDLPQLKRGTIQTVLGVLRKRKIKHTYNSASGEIHLHNGCTIRPLSAMNYLSFRSLEADTIWADELADWGPSGEVAFTRYLAPRLRYSPAGLQYAPRMKPLMRVTMNPPMSTGHWTYELVVKNRYCKCYNVGLRDNYLMEEHEAYIDRQERSMSPDLWPLLIDGQWGNAGSGNVYKGFSRQVHCVDPKPPLPAIALNPNKPLLWALDFNVHLMCSVVAQHYTQQRIHDPSQRPDPYRPISVMSDYTRLERPDYQKRLFYVVDEIRLPNSAVPEVLQCFLDRYRVQAQTHGVVLYGDAAGGARAQQISAQAAARSNWGLIVQGLRAEGIRVEMRVQRQNPSVWDRVNAVKSQMYTKDGVGMFFDEDRCAHTIIDLEAVSWLEGRNEIDKDTNPNLTHLSDALGYMVWVERTLASGIHVNMRNPLDP